MKKYIILLGAICTMVLSGCYKEDPIHAELTKYWRDYDVNSTDPAVKLVSQYWEKFDKVWIYDPDERDYLFNFQEKNDVVITAPTGNFYEKLLLHDELFMQGYSDEFKKEIFPYSVIIADKIVDNTGWSPDAKATFFGARSFLAFKITDADLALDDAGKKALSVDMHYAFILEFCLDRGLVTLNPAFDKVSDYSGNNYIWTEKEYPKEAAYKVALEKGFFHSETWEDTFGFQAPDETKPWRLSFRSSPSSDREDFFANLLSLPDEEMAEIRATYPLIDEKIGYFIEMLESIGIDYKEMK